MSSSGASACTRTHPIIKVDAQSCVIAGDSSGKMEVGRVVVVVGGGYKLILSSHGSPLRVYLGAQHERTVGSDEEEEVAEVEGNEELAD